MMYASREDLISTQKTTSIGNKARGLLDLLEIGCNVPEFLILDHDFLISSGEYIEKVIQEVEKWCNSRGIDATGPWVVRSSASIEDGLSNSWAGQFVTLLNVSLEDIPHAVKKVVQGYESVDIEFTFGVIIQRMVLADHSMVIFSADPMDPLDKTLFVNVIDGPGIDLVSGERIGEAYKILYGKAVPLDERYDKWKNIVQHHVQEIRPVVEHLGQKLNQVPLDLECSVKDGKLYWLQVRPMTAPKKRKVIAVWDKTHSEGNFPGMSSPLTISFLQRTMKVSYEHMAMSMGLPVSRIRNLSMDFNNMCGAVHGRLYYNVTAWQRLMSQMPFGRIVARKLPSIWGKEGSTINMNVSRPGYLLQFRMLFKLAALIFQYRSLRLKFENEFKTLEKEFKTLPLNEMTHDELRGVYFKIERVFGQLWLAPSINGLRLALLNTLAAKVLVFNGKKKNAVVQLNNFISIDEENLSRRMIMDFQRILEYIHSSEELISLFSSSDFSAISGELRKSAPYLLKMIEGYINVFGARAVDSDLKLEKSNYRKDPDLFILRIRQMLLDPSNPVLSVSRERDANSGHKKTQKMGLVTKYLVGKLSDSYTDRETYRYYRSKVFDLVRMLSDAAGKQLTLTNLLERPEDVYFLELHELFPINGNFDGSTLEDKVSGRKASYLSFNDMADHERFYQYDNGFEPKVELPPDTDIDSVHGIGCSQGLVEGEIFIVSDFAEISGSVKGKIVIAENIRPESINLVLSAAGLICERGNLLSHTAILCREMGIPCIVGVRDILNLAEDASKIIMNGESGEVFFIHE